MRRASLSAGVAVLVLALAACVGIPTSGGVQAGPVIDEQLEPEVVVLASGPVAGSDQERILTDFMQAVRSPQNDYAIAQQFLTPQLRSTWDPNASTIIRSSETHAPAAAANTWTYTVATRASVDGEGRYTLQDSSSLTLTFGFEQVDGEWRISQAADGIVLSQSSFDVAFREQPLYFFDPSHAFLVPDVRWFPARATAPIRVVRALLNGPTNWLQGAVQTAFPVATTLGEGSVDVTGNTATVDLSAEALAAGTTELDRMRQQLAATLDTPNVTMTVGGRALPSADPSGNDAIVDPAVDSAALVGVGDQFGFDGGAGVTPIDGLSQKVVEAGADAAVLARDRTAVAFRSADGVGVATITDEPVLLDRRPGLAVPSIDPFLFVWSAQAGSAASLTTFELDGSSHSIQSALPSDATVVSLDVSRDGTRLLLYLSSPVGPQLLVAGIVRQENVPTALGPLIPLGVPTATPVDATWVDDRTVATLSADGAVTAFEVGGPSAALGQVAGGVSIVGGNNGTDGLRVLAGGEIWRPQGSSGWVSTLIPASYLATKQ
ncbi:LpqB family beta-propeller domain-containing protein [Leifsonia sp. H3M29-4]|uniref:GerMN domain-containing protein n=1 Tax=Salinibacterium metalliresistens TaxID=3031321 RepID=UPI0023D9AE0A|nr:GerMN domain-containing protein [Salinibacterium metalliresistens]MDF1479198.1 LpqB family beta-propeller domain-containing protein [Salinibacterium metalliresistens]